MHQLLYDFWYFLFIPVWVPSWSDNRGSYWIEFSADRFFVPCCSTCCPAMADDQTLSLLDCEVSGPAKQSRGAAFSFREVLSIGVYKWAWEGKSAML